MANILVFGGTGYTGGNVVREATSRGHHVVSVSRSHPKDPIEGVRYAGIRGYANPCSRLAVMAKLRVHFA